MLNSRDQEQLAKSNQTANLLVQDLRGLAKSANPLLAEIAAEILHDAAQMEQKLQRIEVLTRAEEKST